MNYTLDNKYLNINIDSLYQDNIQKFMDDYIPSKKIQHLLIQNKWILLDHNPVKRDDDIVGEYLNINLYPYINDYQKIKNEIDIIYEDEFILIVNKPKDLLIHSDNNDDITLNKMVESYYYEHNYININPLHRLDKETSGLVIYSKSIIFQPLFDKMMNEKQIRRSYLAFVEGIMEEGYSETINKPIGKDRHHNNRYVIAGNSKATTRIRCLRNNRKNNYSIIRCRLETGKTHQIRLHLSSLGYPILNDDIYGKKSNLINRMGLIADNIAFFHPFKEEIINIEIDLPSELDELYY